MTMERLWGVMPFLILSAASIAVMLQAAFHRSHRLAAGLTVGALSAALIAVFQAVRVPQQNMQPLFSLDPFTYFFFGLILVSALAVSLLSYGYWEGGPGAKDEFYLLLLLATLGAGALAAGTHFLSFFLGLEVLSVALYGLVGYSRNASSIEAAIKYLVLAAASAAVLLFGMALVYAVTGSLDFSALTALSAGHPDGHRFFTAGIAMIVAGAGFKLAIVPFHFWTPDVYEGAPAPATAFVATVSKGGVVAVLLRFFHDVPILRDSSIFWALAFMAVASMFAGNWLALFQNNVKRLLAYSSIAHLGYLVMAFLAFPEYAGPAVILYAAVYMLTSLGTFGVVTALSRPDREAQELGDYAGLAWRRPGVAAIFTIMLLSLAGLPLTAGFIGKFIILTAGWGSGLYCLSLILIANSVISAFYYLRLIFAMFSEGDEKAGSAPSFLGYAVLTGLSVLVVWIGVYPAPFLRLLQGILGLHL